MRGRSGIKYERVSALDDEQESVSPHTAPAQERVVYYNESHLMEQFQEQPLQDGSLRWGFRDLASVAAAKVSAFTCSDLKAGMKRSLYFLNWLPTYSLADDLPADAIAGLTVGIVLVAQGVAYGLLAGLPAYYGLYASIPPATLYALFGMLCQYPLGCVLLWLACAFSLQLRWIAVGFSVLSTVKLVCAQELLGKCTSAHLH